VLFSSGMSALKEVVHRIGPAAVLGGAGEQARLPYRLQARVAFQRQAMRPCWGGLPHHTIRRPQRGPAMPAIPATHRALPVAFSSRWLALEHRLLALPPRRAWRPFWGREHSEPVGHASWQGWGLVVVFLVFSWVLGWRPVGLPGSGLSGRLWWGGRPGSAVLSTGTCACAPVVCGLRGHCRSSGLGSFG
jgi:hypothetical protein